MDKAEKMKMTHRGTDDPSLYENIEPGQMFDDLFYVGNQR